ncbi:MAG: DUF1919 domain-containing protein [Acutalibacteraceae bacterium]
MDLIRRAERKWYLSRKRRKLKNKAPSILSSNCNGAMILHDMGCRFNTPTVNLYMLPDDFLRFLENPRRYLVAVPQQKQDKEHAFPVGTVEDITVYFMHYSSFEEARDKWIERSARVDMQQVFVMMTDRNGCTEEQIARFDALPYKNKVIFTHKPYPAYKSVCYIKGFEDQKEVGVLSDNKPGFWKRRWLDDFDYVRFLNGDGF